MLTFIILPILFSLILFNLIRVMVYGRSILKPDFERVDERFTQKTGFESYWNTWYGKTIYYTLLAGIVIVVLLLVYTAVS